MEESAGEKRSIREKGKLSGEVTVTHWPGPFTRAKTGKAAGTSLHPVGLAQTNSYL